MHTRPARRKCDPFVRKCTPDPCGASKMQPLRQKVRRKCDPFVNKCPPSSLLQWASTLATSPTCSTSMRHALTSNSPMPVDARANAEQKSEMSAAISARLGYRSLQPHCPSPSPFSFPSCSLRTSLTAQGPQTSSDREIRSPISLRPPLLTLFSDFPFGSFAPKQFASTSAYCSKRRHRINIPKPARFHPEASAPPKLFSAVHSIGMNFRKSKKQKGPPAERCTFSPKDPFDFLLHFQCFISILLCLCDQMGRGIKSSFRAKVTDSG